MARVVASVVEVVSPGRLGPGFRRLLAASWTTNLGDGLAGAAGPLLVASQTGSAFVVSLAALLRWAPQLVFGLSAGVLSDRVDRRRLVVGANVVRVAVLAGLVVLLLTGTATTTLTLVALGLLATTEVFADNAAATLTPMLVHRDDLPVANARLQTGFVTLDQLAGPPLGAALFVAGRASPFVAELVLVVAAVLVLARVALPVDGPRPRQAGNVRGDVVEGLRWTWRHPAVRTLAVTILVFNVTFGAAWGVLVLYAEQRLGLGAFGYGLLITVSAAGGLLGTAFYERITRVLSLGAVMRVGLVLETLTHLGLAVTRSPLVAGVILFVFGVHAFVWGTTSTAVRQRAVPTRLQGRVGSVYAIAVYGGLVLGSAVGGVLASRLGITAPFWFAFAGSAVFLLVLWRELRRIAHDEPAGPLAA